MQVLEKLIRGGPDPECRDWSVVGLYPLGDLVVGPLLAARAKRVG